MAVTFALEGSMRETVPSSELDTQTDPPAASTSSGTAPTGIVSVTFDVAGSMRETEGSPPDSNSEFTTQIAPSPAEIPIGSPPTGIVASIVGCGVALAGVGGRRRSGAGGGGRGSVFPAAACRDDEQERDGDHGKDALHGTKLRATVRHGKDTARSRKSARLRALAGG